MKKIFTILLALVLVLSFSVVATPVSAELPQAELTANITAPMQDANIMGGVEFTVRANVTATGTLYGQDVTATIKIIGNATRQTGQAATKPVATQLPVNATAEVSWILVCTGAGAVNITVTPSGKDPFTLNSIDPSRLHFGTVSIHQRKVLEVKIFAPAGTAFNVTKEFHVTANVTNISSLNATDVKLTLTIDRYAQLKAGEYATRNVTGTLYSSTTSTNFTWALECTADGFSRITVTPSGKVDGAPIPAAALTPATVTISQGVFVQKGIDLVKGWNLISLPLIPLSSAIDVVLAGILDHVISVWHYDAATAQWKNFAPGAPSNLPSMADGKAYWINMKAAQTLNLAGTEMAKGAQLPPAYNMVVGWNMVGFKSTSDNVTAKDYLGGTDYVRIYGFESDTWFLIPGPYYDNPKMEPGRGYWVAFTKPGTIYP